MKSKLTLILLFCFLALILCFPKLALDGSVTGLLLWFHTILPTLLPFIILTSLLIKINAIFSLTKYIYPLFHKLFKVSHYGSYAMLCGFLCGYPMGAKTTAELLKSRKISEKEAQKLLCVCNLVSPAFFINYVIYQTLDCANKTAPLLLILYAAPLLYAFFSRSCPLPQETKKQDARCLRLTFQMLDDSIMDGFETITRLGGYIILFAIIAKIATAFLHTVAIFDTILIGLIELTNGILQLQENDLPLVCSLPCAIFLCSFGGFSGIAQTKSMIQGTSLSIKQYVMAKIKLSLFSLLLALLYCLLLKI